MRPENTAFWALLNLCLLGVNYCKSTYLPVHPIFQWVNIDYKYATLEDRETAISQGHFIPGIARPIDVDLYDDDAKNYRVFITTPRFAKGIPATLSVITDNSNPKPSLAPYPSWDWHNNPQACKPHRLLSVFRIKIDECGRLWVLDTGSINFVQTCPAQILAFNLTNNALIHQYDIPNNQMQSNSLLTLPVVDVRDTRTCSGTFVYVADTRGFAIIVHDVDKRASWRVSDKTMHAAPDYGTMCVAGSQFELMDGIQGMALSSYKVGQDRVLFYHALASNTEQWVWTSKLRNRTAGSDPNYFHLYCDRRNTQSSPMAIDKDDVAYFGLAVDTSLNCWNTKAPYGRKNFDRLYQNSNTLQYITGLKIITRRFKNGEEEIWLANTRVERIVTGPTDSPIINYRVQKASLCGYIGCDKNRQAKECVESFTYCRTCFNCLVED